MEFVDIGRRRFVGRGFAGLAALATVGALPMCRQAADDHERLVEALRALLGPGQSVPAAGIETKMTARDAIEDLSRDLSPAEFDAVLASTKTLREHLAARRQADFEAGRVVYLDGWLLAESELSVAALLGEKLAGGR